MTYRDVLYAARGGVATITINRPQVHNAFRAETCEELIHAFNRAAWDEKIGVIVLTGAGRGFCAGADMNGLQSTVAAGQARAGSTPVSNTPRNTTPPSPARARASAPGSPTRSSSSISRCSSSRCRWSSRKMAAFSRF